ncbi:MAG: YjbH domain-containing protein, partial [Ignavibacterium sp.]|nr:YjbH domain-containing protein [Ignavibacterium sp.]
MNNKIVVTLFFLLLSVNQIFSQGTAGESAKFEYRYLIDMPTAGVLEKGMVGVTTDVLPAGVVVAKMEVGVFQNLSFGISYGAANLIGSGKPNWYELPGVNIRFRLINESLLLPALTFGFDSQGKGEEFENPKRFAIKSPGFFASASKNFQLLGYLSLHGTVNYSLEKNDGDNFLNLWVGAEKTLGPNFSVLAEYDFALNDNASSSFGEGKGYLNVGLRWAIGSGFTLGFDL